MLLKGKKLTALNTLNVLDSFHVLSHLIPRQQVDYYQSSFIVENTKKN
jgi:hypothetical protein